MMAEWCKRVTQSCRTLIEIEAHLHFAQMESECIHFKMEISKQQQQVIIYLSRPRVWAAACSSFDSENTHPNHKRIEENLIENSSVYLFLHLRKLRLCLSTRCSRWSKSKSLCQVPSLKYAWVYWLAISIVRYLRFTSIQRFFFSIYVNSTNALCESLAVAMNGAEWWQ